MTTLVFDYRMDTNGSWQSTPLTGDCLSVRCYLLPNAETQNSKTRRAGGTMCEVVTPRLAVDIALAATNFISDVSKWLYIQRWYSAKQRRIIFKPKTANEIADGLDGYHVFDSDSNTEYLNLKDVKVVFENFDAEDKKYRYCVINLEQQNTFTIT